MTADALVQIEIYPVAHPVEKRPFFEFVFFPHFRKKGSVSGSKIVEREKIRAFGKRSDMAFLFLQERVHVDSRNLPV